MSGTLTLTVSQPAAAVEEGERGGGGEERGGRGGGEGRGGREQESAASEMTETSPPAHLEPLSLSVPGPSATPRSPMTSSVAGQLPGATPPRTAAIDPLPLTRQLSDDPLIK